MLDALASAQLGIARGFDRLDRTAERVAADRDLAELPGNMTELMLARLEVRANTTVARTADDMASHLLDVLG